MSAETRLALALRSAAVAAWLFLGLLSWVTGPARASEPTIPFVSGRVVDQAEVLSEESRASLSGRLKAHEEKTESDRGTTVQSLEGSNVEDYAVAVFKEWKLGQTGKDNGVLFVVAPTERRMRIEVGYGLEGMLTDGTAGRLIRDVMTPRFQGGDYDGGISDGVDAVVAILEGAEAPVAGGSAHGVEADGTEPQAPSNALFSGPDLPALRKDPPRRFHFRDHRAVHRHRRPHTRGRVVPLRLPDPVLGDVSHRRRGNTRRARDAGHVPRGLPHRQADAQENRLVPKGTDLPEAKGHGDHRRLYPAVRWVRALVELGQLQQQFQRQLRQLQLLGRWRVFGRRGRLRELVTQSGWPRMWSRRRLVDSRIDQPDDQQVALVHAVVLRHRHQIGRRLRGRIVSPLQRLEGRSLRILRRVRPANRVCPRSHLDLPSADVPCPRLARRLLAGTSSPGGCDMRCRRVNLFPERHHPSAGSRARPRIASRGCGQASTRCSALICRTCPST